MVMVNIMVAKILVPVPQNFLKSIPKFLPKLTFKNLKYSR